MSKVTQHFDQIAKSYNYHKKTNWYYYYSLERLYQEFIPPKSKILDIGCGTGDILVALDVSKGLGVDISAQMIELARAK